jgi:hypothetical protein
MAEVFSGARARFVIDGNTVGYCAGVSGEEAIDYEPINTLDFLEVREHVPVSYRASLSAAFFRLIGSPLKAYSGRNGDEGNMQIFPILEDVLTSGVMSCAIQDKFNTTIALFEEVRASSKTFDVSSRGVVSENCAFVAIRQRDESQLT